MKFDDDLHVPPFSATMSGEESIIPRSQRRPTVDPLAQRLAFYLLGGAIGLMLLLALANSINPPDAALRDQEMAQLLGPWDGAWSGTEKLYTLSGTPIARFSSTREYWSTSSMIQTERYVRMADDGTSIEQVWVNKALDNGTVVARRSFPETSRIPAFEGRLEEGSLFWTQETEWGKTIRRSWISANMLHCEEFFFPADDSEEATLLVGTFTRKDSAATTE